jgi:hypothetical protein
MPEEILDWYIDCDAETFAQCKNDPKFAYIVTLARSVNALNFVAGALPSSDSISSPANTRDRLNGLFRHVRPVLRGFAARPVYGKNIQR